MATSGNNDLFLSGVQKLFQMFSVETHWKDPMKLGNFDKQFFAPMLMGFLLKQAHYEELFSLVICINRFPTWYSVAFAENIWLDKNLCRMSQYFWPAFLKEKDCSFSVIYISEKLIQMD